MMVEYDPMLCVPRRPMVFQLCGTDGATQGLGKDAVPWWWKRGDV